MRADIKILSTLFILSSCGVEVGNPGQNGTNPKVSQSEDVLTLTVEDQYSEVIESATDAFDARSLALNLMTQDNSLTVDVSCDDSAANTVVSKSVEGEVSFTRGTGSRSRTVNESVNRTTIAGGRVILNHFRAIVAIQGLL